MWKMSSLGKLKALCTNVYVFAAKRGFGKLMCSKSIYGNIGTFVPIVFYFLFRNYILSEIYTIFTSRSPRSARTAGPNVALRVPRQLSVCLFVRPHLSRAQYITSYVTMQLGNCSIIAAFGVYKPSYVQQMKLAVCCLDRKT